MSKATEVERLSKLIQGINHGIIDKIVELLGNYFSTDELEEFNDFLENELE